MFKKALCVMVCLAGVALAGPLDKQQVPAGAKWLLHGDAEALMASKVGQKIQEEAAKPGQAQVLDGLKATFGLDPLKDIKSVTVYGTQFGQEKNVVLLRAKLDREKILNLLKMNPDYKEGKVGETTTYEWVDAAKGDKPAQKKFGAFFGSDLAVMTTEAELLKTALAVLEGKADSLAKSAPAGLAAETPKGAFLVIRVGELPTVGAEKPEAALFNKLACGQAAVGEAEGKVFAEINIEARTEQAAANLKKTGDGFLALLDLMMPEAGQSNPKIPPQFPALVKSAKVTQEGKTVKASATMPAEDLIAMLQWAQKQKKTE